MAKNPNTVEARKLGVQVYPHVRALQRHYRFRLGLPVVKATSTLPWGYYVDPDDEDVWLPDEKCIQALVKLKKYLPDTPFREAAAWITNETGERISYQGLQKLIEVRMPFDEAALPYEERMRMLEIPLV